VLSEEEEEPCGVMDDNDQLKRDVVDKQRELEAATREVVRKQRELEAVTERMTQYRDAFRDERDKAVMRALEAGVSKKELADTLNVTPQWLNKLKRGEAYRRASD
jgi:ribosome-binding protein aMBF1 (putative translation factor)